MFILTLLWVHWTGTSYQEQPTLGAVHQPCGCYRLPSIGTANLEDAAAWSDSYGIRTRTTFSISSTLAGSSTNYATSADSYVTIIRLVFTLKKLRKKIFLGSQFYFCRHYSYFFFIIFFFHFFLFIGNLQIEKRLRRILIFFFKNFPLKLKFARISNSSSNRLMALVYVVICVVC